MNLEEIRNNPAIMMHLRFDLKPEIVIRQGRTKTEVEGQAGFFFYIYVNNNRPRLVLVHMLPDGWGRSPDYISDFPEDMLRGAVKDAGKIKGWFYPINKPIGDFLQMGLRIAGRKRRS